MEIYSKYTGFGRSGYALRGWAWTVVLRDWLMKRWEISPKSMTGEGVLEDLDSEVVSESEEVWRSSDEELVLLSEFIMVSKNVKMLYVDNGGFY